MPCSTGRSARTTPLFLVFTSTGYQKAYGDVYSSPTDIFEARYATGIESLLPSAVPRTQLFAEGKLPRDQLFDSTPPDPSYAPFTPATSPANLAPIFAQGFGPDHLVTNAFRLAYLQDAQANPDGSFPNVLDNRPAANPANGLRRAFKRNDLRTWVPTAPVFLCGGNEDPTVLFMNTQLIQAYWSANGVTAPVTVLDLDSDITVRRSRCRTQGRLRSRESGDRGRRRRCRRGRVLSQHAGAAVLSVSSQVVLRQQVGGLSPTPSSPSRTRLRSSARSDRCLQRAARDPQLAREQAVEPDVARKRHVEVDADVSRRPGFARERRALDLNAHVGVDPDDVRPQPRDVEGVPPDRSRIVTREAVELRRAELAHASAARTTETSRPLRRTRSDS